MTAGCFTKAALGREKSGRKNTLQEIADVLKASKSILIFPHISADGDALGSAAALCAALRSLGKTSHVVLEDKIPETISFLAGCYCTYDQKLVREPDICVMVDCGEMDRIPKRRELFETARETMCIDHHVTTQPFLNWNYIDKDAAATAEIVYDLTCLLGAEISEFIGEAIYTGIVTDTGRFQYSNTTSHTHSIMAELYDRGIKPTEIAIRLYQNVSMEKVILESRIINAARVFADGQAVLSVVTKKMLSECGALAEDADGVVEKLRDLKGIEVAVLIKENNGEFKVSIRSKQWLNAAALSEKRGGGGHVRAAGYSVKKSLSKVKDEIIEEIERNLNDFDRRHY